ncbi:hypothetical protein HYH03_006101 [Edaphochlamys debaryana]|uniref:CBM20 domain-containing protein n=1 Tax=Edaphochlamys debaryana TaxID=47281 RepID=A0A835Y6X7_9CHLO|nr:hypothetical protein HYH03_006101 [Edaphochlamys debaryana]|eukprot:KAG2495863.1 hypothetical protein HYH03_006101 [Edaphochlamys debaryana]
MLLCQRLPSAVADVRRAALPRVHLVGGHVAPSSAPALFKPSTRQLPTLQRRVRSTQSGPAGAAFETILQDAETATGSRRALRVAEEAESEDSAQMVTCRVVVPHFMTKPGQQLGISGSCASLGEWDAARAVPLEWQEGHSHVALVRVPASRLVQAKLVLLEHGKPCTMEEGEPRDLMLMPANVQQSGSAGEQPGSASASQSSMDEPLAGASRKAANPAYDYQIMCHYGNTEATQILRLPVVLPAKDFGDRRVLCKVVVMLDGLKLEPRQFPALVGSVEELGSWNAQAGVKLMRQVGGYWTRRVELPLHEGEIQCKVVICNADGTPALWEPGTSNRVLHPAPKSATGGAAAAMHIFVCRWSQPGHTPVVAVPVMHEDPGKEYVKQLDAAQREIGVMRQAVTAKSRQCQALESELAAARRAERSMRDEVTGLRNEISMLMREVENCQQSELSARQETLTLEERMNEMREHYEVQITFLESKLEEMDAAVTQLQEQARRQSPNGYVTANGNGNGNGNGHHSSSSNGHHNGNGNGNGNGNHQSEKSISRSSWR